MAKQSQLYNMYVDRLNRCSSPDELLTISKEIKAAPLKKKEMTALALACVFAAKYFDKHGGSVDDQAAALECPGEA